MMDRAVTDFPQPDSPTTPGGLSSAHCIRYAVDRLGDAHVGKEMGSEVAQLNQNFAGFCRRFRHGLFPHFGVKGVTKTFPDEVEKRDRHEDGEAWRKDQVEGKGGVAF